MAETHLRQRRLGLLAKSLAPVEQRYLAIAKPDIIEHRQCRSEAQLLRHQRDAKLLRMLGVEDLN